MYNSIINYPYSGCYSIPGMIKTIHDNKTISNHLLYIEDFVFSIICQDFSIKKEDLFSVSRKQGILEGRQMAIYLIYVFSDYGVVRIGEMFSKDHSTVVHSKNVIKNLSQTIYSFDSRRKNYMKICENKGYKLNPKRINDYYYENLVKNLKKGIQIPPINEFMRYAEQNYEGFFYEIERSLKLKYNAWIENEWKDGNDNKIKNWKVKLLNTIPYLKRETTPSNNITSRQNKNADEILKDAQFYHK